MALQLLHQLHPEITFWAAAPKGRMTYAFTQGEIFSSPFSSSFSVPPGFEAQIAASSLNHSLELEPQAQSSNSNLMA